MFLRPSGSTCVRVASLIGLLLAVVSFASANALVLDDVTTVHLYQQTTNNPCVIGDPSCSNGTFPETIFPPNAPSYDEFSPVYTVAQLQAIVGNTILIGVDVNQTVDNQTLSLFTMLINGVVVDTYSANPATPVPPTTGGGNGNGYADYTLSGFTSLAGLQPTDTIQFHVVMPSVNDGREEFFLISGSGGVSEVPEPGTLSLVVGGLLVAAARVIRRYV